LVNRLCSITDEAEAIGLAEPVFKLFWRIIEQDGDILSDQSSASALKSQLRLAIALSIIKLCKRPIFDKLLTLRHFYRLALIVQVLFFSLFFFPLFFLLLLWFFKYFFNFLY